VTSPYQVSKAARGWALMLGGKSLHEAAAIVGETPGMLDRMIWMWLGTKPAAPASSAPCSASTRSLIGRIAEQNGFTLDDMIGPARDRRTSVVRQAAMHAVRTERSHLSYDRIALIFGGRDHTTIMHGVQTHEARMAWVEFLCWAAAPVQPDLFTRAA